MYSPLPAFSRSIAVFFFLFFLMCGSQANSTISEGAAIASIRNNLNLYSRLQDTKNFTALNQVFTQDASPVGLAGPSDFPNNLTGIEEFLRADLGNFTTLHYSDTQYVQLDPSGNTATAFSYGQAVYFGADAQVTGQICTFYETFTDEFVLQGGAWLSQNKTIQIYVCASWSCFLSICRGGSFVAVRCQD